MSHMELYFNHENALIPFGLSRWTPGDEKKLRVAIDKAPVLLTSLQG